MADITVSVSSPGSLSTWGQSSWSNGSWNIFNGTTLSSSSVTIDAEIGIGWGGQAWNLGTWGEVNSSGVDLTGLSLSSSLGDLEFSGAKEGWGRPAWNLGSWGIAGDVLATGGQLTSSLGSITVEALVEVGWGRGGWGNRAWGETYSVLPAGQQATLSQGTAIGKTDFTAVVSGLDLLTITQGLNSIQIDGNVTVFVGEDAMQSSIGTLPSVTGTALVEPSGQAATGSIGQVVPEPKIPVDVTGISMSASLGSITLIQTTNESVSGQAATISQGTVIPIAVYPVTTAGLLTGSVGQVSISGAANISVSGIGLTANIGTVNITAWSEINPGVNNVWTEVDRAA